ncbi:MAG: fibronectin type III domain-containing protein [Spirochaetales bacterium]|nr:fibronectin type III domain-containing protein [Spirochaetales bacterium]
MKKPTIALSFSLAMAGLVSCPAPAVPAPGVPAAPDNLGVNGISSTCVELRWDDNSGNEEHFIVERADDAGFTVDLTETILGAGTVLFRDNADVSPGLTRFYRVYAWNGYGRSTAAAFVSATPPAPPATPSGSRIADHTVVDRIRRGTLPITAIQTAKTSLHIAYGHTSHGSQLADGMGGLVGFANGGACDGTFTYSSQSDLFASNQDGSGSALHLFEGSQYDSGDMELDCGYYPRWVNETHDFLGAPDAQGRGSNRPEYNVVIWSWCGQASGYDEQTMIDHYLAPMDALEAEYWGVTFVYMTCHLNTADAWTEQNLLARDEQVRRYCLDHGKWLFDFSDIETYDPDGVFYAGRHPNDACNYDFNNNGITEQDGDTVAINGDRNWAIDWQNSHTEGVDWYSCGAAHSQPVNANMKAYAAWWLWCRIPGWDGN